MEKVTERGWYRDPDDDARDRFHNGYAWNTETRAHQDSTPDAPAATWAQPRRAAMPVETKHPGPRGGDTAIACPHCGQRGTVSTRSVRVKRGISGGKATGAVLTLGWSMLATGLSRKEEHTEMTCSNCHVKWLV